MKNKYGYVMVFSLFLIQVRCYWDIVSTTIRNKLEESPRRSFFEWEYVSFLSTKAKVSNALASVFGGGTNVESVLNEQRRRLCVFAGISIDFKCLSTGIILSRRLIITAYNFLDPHMNRMNDLRVWALGRGGTSTTPYRYRVLRVIKVVPKSLNPEHCHGSYCTHSPRHDVALIYTLDQMYLFHVYPSYNYFYAHRTTMPGKYDTFFNKNTWFGGTAFLDMEHVIQNYKIAHAVVGRDHIVDCSRYLPKWWGKFVCVQNTRGFVAVPNGGGLFSHWINLKGIGCFEIRYNDERIMVFTDLRYYRDIVDYHARYAWPGFYYEYAYPQWGMPIGTIYDGGISTKNNPKLAQFNVAKTLWYPV